MAIVGIGTTYGAMIMHNILGVLHTSFYVAYVILKPHTAWFTGFDNANTPYLDLS